MVRGWQPKSVGCAIIAGCTDTPEESPLPGWTLLYCLYGREASFGQITCKALNQGQRSVCVAASELTNRRARQLDTVLGRGRAACVQVQSCS